MDPYFFISKKKTNNILEQDNIRQLFYNVYNNITTLHHDLSWRPYYLYAVVLKHYYDKHTDYLHALIYDLHIIYNMNTNDYKLVVDGLLQLELDGYNYSFLEKNKTLDEFLKNKLLSDII